MKSIVTFLVGAVIFVTLSVIIQLIIKNMGKDSKGNLKELIFNKDLIKKLLLRISFPMILIFMLSGFYTVNEQTNAVVTTAGKATSIVASGPHYRIPILQNVIKVNMTTQGMAVGYIESEEIGGFDESNYNLMISNDFNIISIDFYAEWRVTDPAKYVFSSQDPVSILNNVIQSSARDIISSHTVDSILTDGKSEIQTNIRTLTNELIQDYDIGVMVTSIIIQDAEPPTDLVAEAFKQVEDARQNKDTLLNEANQYYNEEIPLARVEADKIIKNATSQKEVRINEAKGQVGRFNELYAEYINNPDITRNRMYLEAMESILPSLDVYIDSTGDGSILKMLDINK